VVHGGVRAVIGEVASRALVSGNAHMRGQWATPEAVSSVDDLLEDGCVTGKTWAGWL